MHHITLAVSQRVLDQVYAGDFFQRQLAIRDASPEIAAQVGQASSKNRVEVAVCGVFVLSVGDTSAIWGTHQSEGTQFQDFDDLFSLLARRPDMPVTFRW
jgi:hypothetical protein